MLTDAQLAQAPDDAMKPPMAISEGQTWRVSCLPEDMRVISG